MLLVFPQKLDFSELCIMVQTVLFGHVSVFPQARWVPLLLSLVCSAHRFLLRVACPLTRSSCPAGDSIPLFTVKLPKYRIEGAPWLEALAMPLFCCGFSSWLTAQDALFPILLAKKTYPFWRSHFMLVLCIWFFKCVYCLPYPPTNPTSQSTFPFVQISFCSYLKMYEDAPRFFNTTIAIFRLC